MKSVPWTSCPEHRLRPTRLSIRRRSIVPRHGPSERLEQSAVGHQLVTVASSLRPTCWQHGEDVMTAEYGMLTASCIRSQEGVATAWAPGCDKIWTCATSSTCRVTAPPTRRTSTPSSAILDHVDRRIRRYIRAKQKLIKLLEEQKQAIIHQAVTRGLDPNVRLKPSGVEWLGDVPEHWDVRRVRDFRSWGRLTPPRGNKLIGLWRPTFAQTSSMYRSERIITRLSTSP